MIIENKGIYTDSVVCVRVYGVIGILVKQQLPLVKHTPAQMT